MRGKTLFALGLAVLGLNHLDAQDPALRREFKFRMAFAADAKDQLAKQALGLGFNLGLDTRHGRFGAEVGYFYKTGDPFLAPVAPLPSGSTLSPTDAGGDSRRNQLDGLTLRFSYSQPLTGEDLRWQAGLQLGGTRFRHQYTGDIVSTDWKTTNATSWRDTYRGVPVEGGLKPSLFGGLTWKLQKASSLEVNLLLLNYTALDYRHATGSGTYQSTANGGRLCVDNVFPADRLDKTNRLVPHLEVGYVFHF